MGLFFLLVLSHFVCDFSLQSDWVAKNKCPEAGSHWPWVLTSHAATHAAGVWIVTNSWQAATAQFMLHAAIDFGKCRGRYGFHSDQVMHLAVMALLAWRLS